MLRQIPDGNDRWRWGKKDRGGQPRVLIFIIQQMRKRSGTGGLGSEPTWCPELLGQSSPRCTAEGTRCPGGVWHLNHNGWDDSDKPTLPSQPWAPQAAWVSLSALIPIDDELCVGQCGARLSCWVITETGEAACPSQGQEGVQKGQCCGSGPCLPSSFLWLRTTLVPWMADSPLRVLPHHPLYLFSDKDACHWTCPTPTHPR